jgi:acyl-CoA dehydrogenase
LRTRAERIGCGWRINGRKWFITGADGAQFFIVMARTSGEPGERGGATTFLVDADTPGVTLAGTSPHWTARCSVGTAK